MQIRPFAALPLALVLAVASCRGREPAQPPHAPRAAILKEVPAAAYSVLRDTAGTADAEQRTYTAQLPFDTTAAFYRAMLPVLGWQVMGDRSDRPAGMIDLYARRGIQTLWVHIEKQSEATTRYTLIATADTTTPRPAPTRGRRTR
ncbi:MAG: hypothetical protein ACHQU8_06285 [Gemmatimonadales bacterium]